jgi:predicted TIM-barrel fold metal-dependent hydrolase
VPWTEEMISMAWKHENVFIGTDAYAPKHWPDNLVRYMNSYGQDKVLFGTDWPASHQKVMRDNALRLFNLERAG